MPEIVIRKMERQDWAAVGELIQVGTNAWYRANGKPSIFTGDPDQMDLFCSVYEDLDPGCCVLAVNARSGQLAGSCFYHPRPTHVSVGIMNVHPNYFGRGVARRLLGEILEIADRSGRPVRLVSSALNLDSFSLYTRAGFVPRTAYQDMFLPVPIAGLGIEFPARSQVRDATLADAEAMAALEQRLCGISRLRDYRYFLENRDSIWHASVFESAEGELLGFLVSVSHPASSMLGPGAAQTQEQAGALILGELNHHRGRSPIFLIPVQCTDLVQHLYLWGAKNCEIHFAQVRGVWVEPSGVVMPTFMPETG